MLVVEFIGLLIIITGAAWLLSVGAEHLAQRYGANFTGSILLALITTLPEYMFVFFAALKAEYSAAIGSAVGACTLLVTLGYGSVILVATTRLSRVPVRNVTLSRETQIDAVYLGLTALVAFLLAWEGGGLDLKDGLILTFMFAVYVVQHYRIARKHVAKATQNSKGPGILRAVIMMVIGGGIILLTSELFVDSMLEIAHRMKVDPMAITIILSPIASELPEKITAYLTVMRDGKLAEISVCNFMGSKINHNSLLLAVMAFVAVASGKSGVPGVISLPFILMTVLTFIAVVSLSRRKLERWEGWMFLSLYLTIIAAAFIVR